VEAAQALGQLGEKAPGIAVPALIQVLRTPYKPYRLEKEYEFETISRVGTTLRLDPEAKVHLAVIDALGSIGSGAKAAVPHLIAVFGQDRITASGVTIDHLLPQIRAGTLNTQEQQQVTSMAWIGSADLACSVGATQAIAQIGEAAIPALLQALKAAAPNTRSLAARTLGYMGRKAAGAVPALKVAAQDTEEIVRESAKDALAKITSGT
jgi:HEAT repeat protein